MWSPSHAGPTGALYQGVVTSYHTAASRKSGADPAKTVDDDFNRFAGRRIIDLDKTAGQHDVSTSQHTPSGGQVVGEPSQRFEGMAHHIGALPPADFNTIDRQVAGRRAEVEIAPLDDRIPSRQPAPKKSSAISVAVPMVAESV